MTRILRKIEAAESGRSTPAPDMLPQSATAVVPASNGARIASLSPRPFISGSDAGQSQTRSRRPSTGHRASSPTATRSRERRSRSADRGSACSDASNDRRSQSLPRASSNDTLGPSVRTRRSSTQQHEHVRHSSRNRRRRSASSTAVRATFADRAGAMSPVRPGSPALLALQPPSEAVPGLHRELGGHGAWASLSSVVHRAVEGTIVHPGEALAPLRAFASTLSGVAHVDPATARTFWFDEGTSSWITQSVDVGYLREAQLASLAGSPREWQEKGDEGEQESA